MSAVDESNVWRAQVIPHYALSMDQLPEPTAPWSELLNFAGTFDGCVVHPGAAALREYAWESRKSFLRDGTLPEGLTELRAALHGEQRIDYWGDGEGSGGEERHAQALVQRIRQLVESGEHLQPPDDTDAGVQDKLMNAYDRLLVGYSQWGGWRFHGWSGYEDPDNNHGPVIWSEADAVLRFALELEREWPLSTHTEFAIGKASRLDFDQEVEGRPQRVDIAVSNMTDFQEPALAGTFDRFREHEHEVFVEVKWFVKGWAKGGFPDAQTRLRSVPADLTKLARHAALGRCRVAAMLVVDDERYFEEKYAAHLEDLKMEWPGEVWNLYVGPSALERRGLDIS